MRASAVNPGDLVEVEIRGVRFEATVRRKPPGLIGIDPVDPKRFTYRHCSARQVRRVVERRGHGASETNLGNRQGASGPGSAGLGSARLGNAMSGEEGDQR